MMLKGLRHTLIMLLLTMSGVSVAEEKQYLLTEATYKSLEAAQNLLAEEQYKAAEKQLKSLLGKVKPDSYDQAVVLQTIGYLYSSTEDYKKAATYFGQAIALNALPPKVVHNLEYNLAQLLLASEQYKKGIQLLEKWLKKEASPPNSAYVLLASAHYRVKNYKKVVTAISTAIKRDKSPQEAWYQVLLAAHLELKQYKSAINVLETLITRYPYKKSYWDQLASLYYQQKKSFATLAVRSLAKRLELGDNKTLLSLVDMYRFLHIPFKAAEMLQKGIDDGVVEADYKNLTTLADSWLAAREFEVAAEVLAKVVSLDDSGQSDLKLGRVRVTLEQWDKAITPLQNSLTKLATDKQGEPSLLLGMALFHQGKLQQAEKMFSQAISYKQQRNQAGQWLRHLNTEKDKTADATESGTT